jgi:putative transposase
MSERLTMARSLVDSGKSRSEACRLAGIGRSSFYRVRKGRTHRPLDPERERVILWEAGRFPIFGAKKIRDMLRVDGFRINHKSVARYLRLHHLQCKRRSRGASGTRRLPWTCPIRSNVRWEMDIKVEVLYDGSWAFLFAIIDAFDRETIAWSSGDRCRAAEAIAVLEQAVIRRFAGMVPDAAALSLRVDHGSCFIARAFRQACRLLNVKLEICGVRCSNDKPYIESLFAQFELEKLGPEPDVLESPRTFAAAADEYFAFYNVVRPHGSLRRNTPRQAALASGAYIFNLPETDSKHCAA